MATTPAIRPSLTNLRFQRTAADCRNSRSAMVIAMQQLAAAEPWTVSGGCAAHWLLKHTGPRPLPAASDVTAMRDFCAELFGEDTAAEMFD